MALTSGSGTYEVMATVALEDSESWLEDLLRLYAGALLRHAEGSCWESGLATDYADEARSQALHGLLEIGADPRAHLWNTINRRCRRVWRALQLEASGQKQTSSHLAFDADADALPLVETEGPYLPTYRLWCQLVEDGSRAGLSSLADGLVGVLGLDEAGVGGLGLSASEAIDAGWSEELAQELVSAVFVDLLARGRKPLPYLKQMVTNVCIDEARRRGPVDSADAPSRGGEEEGSAGSSVLDELESGDITTTIEEDEEADERERSLAAAEAWRGRYRAPLSEVMWALGKQRQWALHQLTFETRDVMDATIGALAQAEHEARSTGGTRLKDLDIAEVKLMFTFAGGDENQRKRRGGIGPGVAEKARDLLDALPDADIAALAEADRPLRAQWLSRGLGPAAGRIYAGPGMGGVPRAHLGAMVDAYLLCDSPRSRVFRGRLPAGDRDLFVRHFRDLEGLESLALSLHSNIEEIAWRLVELSRDRYYFERTVE